MKCDFTIRALYYYLTRAREIAKKKAKEILYLEKELVVSEK
jgi:hypothetical protein